MNFRNYFIEGKKKLKKTWQSGKTYDEFELLENEKGVPKIFGSQNENKFSKPGLETIAKQAEIGIDEKLFEQIQRNITFLKSMFGSNINKDVVFREFKIGGKIDACVISMSGMADAKSVNENVLRQCMRPNSLEKFDDKNQNILKYLAQNIINISEIQNTTDFAAIAKAVLCGMSVVLVENSSEALLLETRGFAQRSIGEPKAEKAIVGPQEAFVEGIRTNITLIRRIVQTTDLVCEFKPLGGENNLQVGIMYRKGIANAELVAQVEKRIGAINTKFMLGEGMTTQFIETRKFSPVSQVLNTERPDRAAALIMSGHVALVFDGSPYCSIVPATFFTFMSAPDDTYLRKPLANMVRIVRYAGLFAAIFLPALYVALLNFHPSIISTELIDTIMQSRSAVSFGVEYEMLFLMIIFQLVRECGIRVPGAMGQSLSVIAAIVLGQASVSASLVSSIMLIIVATSGLGNYCIPDLALQSSATWVSLLLIFAASIAGLFGMSIVFVVLMVYLCSIKSFGVPFFAPFAPKTFSNRGLFSRGVLKAQHSSIDYLNTQES